MSTLKSSSTDLTLNADGVGNDIIFQSNAGQVGSLTAEGVLTATSYAGSGAALTNIVAASGVATDATKMPLAGGAFTGAVTTNSTFDGVDIATRDAILTSTTTTAGAALPKTGGAMTGAITTNSTFDGVDIATRDAILTSTTTTAGAALPKAGGTMTGALTTLSISETETTKTASFTPNLTTEGTIFDVSGGITITMPSVAAGKSFTIIDAGTGTLAWSGTILWPSGTAPSPSGKTIYSFISNGTNWYGMMAGTGFA
jgi:hypothetical protein